MTRRRHLPTSDPRPSVWAFRRGERALLAVALVSVAAGMAVITLGTATSLGHVSWLDGLPLLLFAAAVSTVHLVLLVSGSRCDTRLPALTLLLVGVGLVLQTRLETIDFNRGFRLANCAFPVGVMAMLGAALAFRRGRWRLLAAARWPCFLLALAVLGMILLLGHRFRGAVYLPGNINPTEIIKILLILFTAGFIAAHEEALRHGRLFPVPVPAFWLLALCWAMPITLLVIQRDLGMALILGGVLAMMLWLATGRWLVPAAALAASVPASIGSAVFLQHVQRRLTAWINPFEDPTGAGWQVLQGLTALYNGGMWGRGIGEGAPELVPIASSDFIYTAVGEDLGFAGCMLISSLFLLLLVRGLRIAASREHLFPALMVAGFAGALALQTIVNVGGVVKALPLTGVTLPFISHGGSSLVTSFIMIGLILAVSDDGKSPENHV